MTSPPASPPLRDAHVHLLPLGQSLTHIDLSDTTTLDQALQRIALAAGAARAAGPTASPSAPSTPWLIASGFRAQATDQRRLPTRDELDQAGQGLPVLVNSFDLHAASVSSAILRAADLHERTPDPPGGTIGRDPATGRLNGYVAEAARFLIRAAEPPPTPAQRREHLRLALARLRARHIVEAHDMFATAELADLLLDLDDRDALAHTVWLYAVPDDLPALRARMAERTRDGRVSDSGRVVFAGLKLFLDGTLNSRTASMLTPFRDPVPEHPRGMPLFTDAQLIAHFRGARAQGLGLAVHAIGDAAVRQALDCWAATLQTEIASPPLPFVPPLRIEHAQFVDPADVPRFAAMEVVASVQPCHLLTDIEALRRLTPHALDRAFPLRDLIDAARATGRAPGSLIWMGSDAPVVPAEPADNVQAATGRCRAGMDPAGAIAPAQAITAEQALALHGLTAR
jgi:predicted amidohydrolase YtcJ